MQYPKDLSTCHRVIKKLRITNDEQLKMISVQSKRVKKLEERVKELTATHKEWSKLKSDQLQLIKNFEDRLKELKAKLNENNYI